MANSKKYHFILAVLFLFSPLDSYAQDKGAITGAPTAIPRIETDRPDQTESPVTTPKKYFQAELGFNREQYKDGTIRYLHPAGLYKYGISNRVELRVEAPILTEVPPAPLKQASGLEAVELGTKVALFEEKGWRPKTSFIAHVGFPFLSSKQFRPDNIAAIWRFTCQNTLTPYAGLGYNAGMFWDGNNSAPVYFYTFSPGFNIGRSWYAYIEAFGFMSKGQLPEHDIAVGTAWFISNDVKIDLSGGMGIDPSPLNNYVALGLSFRFSVLK